MNLKSYLIILLISALISCTKDKTNTCTIIPSYDVEISSIINSYCIACHQSGNTAGGINLENENWLVDAVAFSDYVIRKDYIPSEQSLDMCDQGRTMLRISEQFYN